MRRTAGGWQLAIAEEQVEKLIARLRDSPTSM
jgi:hypothetical protein